ncbi:acyltransferase [Stenotrophomonas sp. MA5]|jgi:acetyltransferase-like isoleucine patch superfamily enzyme|nr:acyltransferase [Stenotrophomonas sp. MA5]
MHTGGTLVGTLYKLAWVLRAFLVAPFFGRFGRGGYLGPPAFISGSRRMYFGRAVRIFPGLRAECIGTGSLTVGDDVSIGQGFHVIASGSVEIGEGALISANVFVTDTDHGFDNPDLPILRQPNVIRPTFIGRRCFLGVGARIQAGTQLGDGCVVGANAVVKGAFPPYSMLAGAPARVVKHYDFEQSAWVRSGSVAISENRP